MKILNLVRQNNYFSGVVFILVPLNSVLLPKRCFLLCGCMLCLHLVPPSMQMVASWSLLHVK